MYIIIFILTAILYAVHETVSYRFSESVFKNKNPNFWNGQLSNKAAKKIFGYPLDAQHLSIVAIFILATFGIVIAQYPAWHFNIFHLSWIEQVLVSIGVWIICFYLFFNKILVSAAPPTNKPS